MNWKFTDEQNTRISNLVNESDDEDVIMEAWQRLIEQTVQFPFKAEVIEWQEKSAILRQGDILKVHSIDDIDDKYGIIAMTRFGRKKILFSIM